MKRLALVAAVFALAACSTDNAAETADTTTPAMAPAPAPAVDTAAKMDTTKTDTTKADSATKTP